MRIILNTPQSATPCLTPSQLSAALQTAQFWHVQSFVAHYPPLSPPDRRQEVIHRTEMDDFDDFGTTINALAVADVTVRGDLDEFSGKAGHCNG